jgi:hypothetical protein
VWGVSERVIASEGLPPEYQVLTIICWVESELGVGMYHSDLGIE